MRQPFRIGRTARRRGFIGTLVQRAQARYRAATAGLHKSLADMSFIGPATVRPARIVTMRIALYEPDIPQNTGTMLRLCACLGIEAHVVEPAGFPVTDRAFRRAGMDYLDRVSIVRHASFPAFEGWLRSEGLRLVLMTTTAERSYLDHAFSADDVVLFGRESAGVPEAVHRAADVRLRIPIRDGLRSLNVAMAAAMVAGEALRQAGGLKTE
jgi:tRNA (cytidine/uridine-2'-O-)-methyltransferase